MYDKEKYNLLTCYHCGNQGLLSIEHAHRHEFGDVVFDAYGEVTNVYVDEVYHWQLLSCPVCHRVTLWENMIDPTLEYADAKILYPLCTIDYTGVPSGIKTAFESALKVKNIDTAICSLALRRVLEAICKDKGAKGNNLEKMIENMIERGILPEMYDDACWIIRQLGNSAAHADKKVFSMHQLDQTIEFVQNIINYLYTLPVKMKNLRDAIEAEKQASKAASENNPS